MAIIAPSTDTATPNTDGGEILNHYLLKTDITAGIVEGRPARALCGEVFVPHAQGGGETSVIGAAICPLCARRYQVIGTPRRGAKR